MCQDHLRPNSTIAQCRGRLGDPDHTPRFPHMNPQASFRQTRRSAAYHAHENAILAHEVVVKRTGDVRSEQGGDRYANQFMN